MTAPVFTEHRIADETKVHFGEHEIHFTFNYDSGAYAFSLWWEEEGEKAFVAWAGRHSDARGLFRAAMPSEEATK